jgi:hypothetical protein
MRKSGGYITGKQLVEGNSPKNDTVPILASPGELVIDKETIDGGPMSILHFAMKELSQHHPGYKKAMSMGGWASGYDGGGIISDAVDSAKKYLLGHLLDSNVSDEINKMNADPVNHIDTGIRPQGFDDGGTVGSNFGGVSDTVRKANPQAGSFLSNKPTAFDNAIEHPIDTIANWIQGKAKGGVVEKPQKKVHKVMGEFKSGKLSSSSGQKVTNPKQAIAIAMSEAGLSKSMAEGGTVNNTISPDNAFNQYVPEKGIIGGTVYDGSTDERFLFGDYCFDIDKARMMCGKQDNGEVPVSQKWIDKIAIDHKEAMKSKSKNPVFIAQVHTPNGIKPLLIDGNHRMYKAIEEGLESIPAYIFSPEQTASLFCPKPEGVDHPKYGSMNLNQNLNCGGTVQKYYSGGVVKGYNNGGKIDFQPIESAQPKIDFQKAETQPETSMGDKAQTYLENFGNAVSLGYLPQLQAGATKGLEAVGALPETKYLDERDANIQRIAQESERNPEAATIGKIGGTISGGFMAPEAPVLKGAGLMKSIGRGAIIGTGYGAAQNPGDVPGELSPLQAEERAKNAGKGALIGAGMGAASSVAQKGISALRNSADAAQEVANTQAVRASGGMLKDFRKMNARNQVDDIGQFALDNKIVEAGDSVHDVAEKANDFRKQSGDNLSKIYSEAQSAAEQNKAANAMEVNPNAPKQIGTAQVDANVRGFNPSRDSDEILKSVQDEMGDSPKAASALNEAKAYMEQLKSKYGDNILDPKVANNIKTELDKEINYNRNPLTKDPAKEQAYSQMRDYINKAVQNHVDDLGNATGNPELANQLKQANKDYGYARQLQNMAQDRVSRETANRMFGLTDTIAAGAGGIAGLAEGAAMGHPIEGGIVGLGAGLVNKAARTYGPSVLAGAANAAAPILEKTAVPLGNALSKIPAQGLEKAAIQGATNNYKSSGGYQKWYADGVNNLINHADRPEDKKMIESMREKLSNDPKGQQLLLEASTLKPGSKRMGQVLQRIKGMQQ